MWMTTRHRSWIADGKDSNGDGADGVDGEDTDSDCSVGDGIELYG